MSRPLIIGNGSILVAFDANMTMRDFYYPYVGQWNHIMGHKNNLGFWVEGKFTWIDDQGWERMLGYRENSLVATAQAVHKGLALSVESMDAVHYQDNIYVKSLTIKNLSGREREVRVFFTHDFSIDETEVGDTALYDPQLRTVYHYKKNRYFMINGFSGHSRFHQYAAGTKRFAGAEGTWRDAEDGALSCNPIAQGSVDSAISFRLYLGAQGEQTVYYWIVAGRNFQEVRALNNYVWERGARQLLHKIHVYWRNWLNQEQWTFADLPEQVRNLYYRSLLTIRTHFDRRGAVVAAVDSDIMQTNRDHYCYLWPRDGALTVYALIRAGYGELAEKFFAFCANALTESGYLLHKYNPDGTLGSSWHPWLEQNQLPIQEDETALVLFCLWQCYKHNRDIEMAHEYYRSLARPMADFMCGYVDRQLELPLSSYDLWEEKRGIFTFTAATVYAGLKAAADLAELFSDDEQVTMYREQAEKIKESIAKHLYDPVLGRFIRGLVWDDQGSYFRQDTTLESSLAGLFLFNVFGADDPRLTATMRAIEEGLWVKTGVGGLARYTNDCYFQRSNDIQKVPGNPWFICTLWLAQWYIAKASTVKELTPAKALLHWAAVYALETGVMAEQLHPETGEPLSVAPLTWSHATYVLATLDYLDKYAILTGDSCRVNLTL
ncbi:MAG TPA: glycoside hydrolase family 15 [Desulfotomaculum sp.]|jgi:GH15 family glucan-1,4-alpha-glucosidase|nr:glycoside hydrolase family 15 [Desulfotomaculum sp.]